MGGMKEFSKRFFVGFIIMVVLVFSILISKWIVFLSTAFPASNIKVEVINFKKENVTIYIVIQNYGLNNQHVQTIISQNNISLDNISVNQEKDIVIKGRLVYSNITPLKSDIMGPFAYFPFMECVHGVLSLNHKVNGSLFINNEEVKFIDAKGYIEKDSGKSFPKTYLWIQCNDFKIEDTSIMVSIADIPFLGFEFKGCIAVVYYKGKEYRLATYNGVKLISYDENGLIIKRGKYRLEINIKNLSPQSLLAPNGGDMIRTIYENIACSARFKFYKDKNLIFDLESSNTSFEYVSK